MRSYNFFLAGFTRIYSDLLGFFGLWRRLGMGLDEGESAELTPRFSRLPSVLGGQSGPLGVSPPLLTVINR